MARHVNGSSVPPERVSPSPKDDTTSAVVHVQAQDEDRIRIKNRRKRYLDLHPELIRRFQSPAERQREGRERGYTGSLEADLMRLEAKLEALRHPDMNSAMAYRRAEDGSITGVEADREERAGSKEEGRARWVEVMRQRFLRGEDGDFEYEAVDENEDLDDRGEEEQRYLEAYLARQSEEFVGEDKPRGETGVQDF
ncbi:hypothetical protein B0A54_02794 [Friedmanniomyces endolithicus]|uniref:CCD97-like C-terminal domain-containing protein n=1 Tax=Friedmanniomyces endolithicus TaxID=329885 RepID=A0A4U0VGF6_9PEZI|nr:hypothetical protein B0A54_02794 [Friedmanniomyces endolithicus]